MQTKSFLVSACLLSLVFQGDLLAQTEPTPVSHHQISLDVSRLFYGPWLFADAEAMAHVKYAYAFNSKRRITAGFSLIEVGDQQSQISTSLHENSVSRGFRNYHSRAMQGYLQFNWTVPLKNFVFYHGPGIGYGRGDIYMIEQWTSNEYDDDCIEPPVIDYDCPVVSNRPETIIDRVVFRYGSIKYVTGIQMNLSKRFSFLAGLNCSATIPLSIQNKAESSYSEVLFERSHGNGFDIDPEFMLAYSW